MNNIEQLFYDKFVYFEGNIGYIVPGTKADDVLEFIYKNT